MVEGPPIVPDEQRSTASSGSFSNAALDLFQLYDEDLALDQHPGLNSDGSTDDLAANNMVEKEMREYEQIERSNSTNDDPLEWWKANEKKLPLHASVACGIYSIPAGSASVENNFSIAGLFCRKEGSVWILTNPKAC